MKKLIAILGVLVLATPAWALVRRWELSQNLTGTAPSASNCTQGSTSTSCGLSLAGAQGYRICMTANSGQTLTNIAADVYVYDYDDNLWAEVPSLAWSATAVGSRKACTASAPVSHPYTRLYVVPNGTTVSGGTTVEVSAEATY